MLKQLRNFFSKSIGKKYYIGLLVLSFFLTALNLPNLYAPILVDKYITQIQNKIFSFTIPIILITIYGCVFLLNELLMYPYGRLFQKSRNRLNIYMIEKILKTNPSRIKDKGEGYYHRIIEQALDTLMMVLTPVTMKTLYQLVQSLFILGMFFFINKVIGIICCVIFLLYFFTFIINNKLFSKVLSAYLEKNEEASSVVFDFIKNNKILIFSERHINFAKEKIIHLLTEASQLDFKLQYMFDLMFGFISQFILPVSNILIIFILGKEIFNGTSNFSTLVMSIMFFNMFLSGANCFQSLSEMLFHSKGSLDMINGCLSENCSDRNKCDISSKDFFISFTNAKLKAGDKDLLDDATLDIPLGFNYTFSGTSGTGKSTFTDCIISLAKPCKGDIFFMNKNNNCSNVWTLEQIAYYTQNCEIFNMNLQDNIFFSDQFNQDEYDYYVKELDLYNLENRMLGSDGANTSGGEKQRVALARFLHQLKTKDFYLIDEAFLSVDNITKLKMLSMVKEAIKGKTGICISHDDEVIKHMGTKKIILQNKKIILL